MTTFQYAGMLQATTKVLNLWNGSSNDLPPTDWQLPGFDDSGWATSSGPTTTTIYKFRSTRNGTGDGHAFQTPLLTLPIGCESIAPWDTPPHVDAAFAARTTFEFPSTPYAYYMFEQFIGNPSLFMEGEVEFATPGSGMWLNGTNVEGESWDVVGASLGAGMNLVATLCGFPFTGPNYNSTDEGWQTFRFTFWDNTGDGGQAVAWGTPPDGASDNGVLGTADTNVAHLTATTVDTTTLPTNIIKIVSNGSTTLFLTADQELWGCGSNADGILTAGGATDTAPHDVPVQITLPLISTGVNQLPPVDIGIGAQYAAAIGRAGDVVWWGDLLGTGSLGFHLYSGTLTVPAVPSAGALAAGSTFMGYIGQNGKIYTQGDNSDGQTGQNTAATPVSFAEISRTPNWTDLNAVLDGNIAAGDAQMLVYPGVQSFPADGTYGAGRALEGQLGAEAYSSGSGTNKDNLLFVEMDQGRGPVQSVGPMTFILIPGQGRIFGFGDGVPYGGAADNDGTIVYGTDLFADTFSDIRITPDLSIPFVALAQGGGSHNPYVIGDSRIAYGAIGSDGLLYTWGYGGYGQMGSGADPLSNLTPVSINGLGGVIYAHFANGVAFAIVASSTPPALVGPGYMRVPISITSGQLRRRGRSYVQLIGRYPHAAPVHYPEKHAARRYDHQLPEPAHSV